MDSKSFVFRQADIFQRYDVYNYRLSYPLHSDIQGRKGIWYAPTSVLFPNTGILHFSLDLEPV